VEEDQDCKQDKGKENKQEDEDIDKNSTEGED
jgi:hypothetical protein